MKIEKKLKGGHRPFLSEDERTLVTTSSRNTVYVYDLENRKLTHSIKTVSNVSRTMVSRDGKRLAAKNTGGVIAVISLESGEEICRSRMEKREGEPMVFLDNEGLRLLDLDWDGRTMLLDCGSINLCRMIRKAGGEGSRFPRRTRTGSRLRQSGKGTDCPII